MKDSFITNDKEKTSKKFDVEAKEFIDIPEGDKLPRQRDIIKIGFLGDKEYRGAFVVYPSTQITSTISSQGLSADSNYTIERSILILTSVGDAPTDSQISAFMATTKYASDESMSWEKPSEKSNASWLVQGGDSEPSFSGSVINGLWEGNKLKFDITPIITVWKGNASSNFSMIIHQTSNTGEVIDFHSTEATQLFLGGSPSTNCNFLASGNINSYKSQGIRVLLTANGVATNISLVDSNQTAALEWSAFNASIYVGSTFTINSPDKEQGIVLGSITCTLNNKTTVDNLPTLDVSGISLGNIAKYYTTAEFSTTSILPSGSGILELTSPSANMQYDLSKLISGKTLHVKYIPTSLLNNNHSFTIDFVGNEMVKNNRFRIYLKEAAISENRIGLPTELMSEIITPKLDIDLLV